MIAPTIGATINAYTCWRATLPMNKAGAKLCAGLTEVPVNGIHKMCTNARVKSITIPATIPVFFTSSNSKYSKYKYKG